MKLAHLTKTHFEKAFQQIDKEGYWDNLWNQYWIVYQGKEYPFKLSVYLADKCANGYLHTENIDFQSNESYRNYVEELGFSINYYPEEVPFFNLSELEFFRKYSNKVYDKINESDQNAARRLVNTVWHKTLYWAKKVAERTELSTEGRSNWSERGWEEIEEVKHRVSRFKKYTWVKIFAEADKGKGVFFTVGMSSNTNALEYKIDCQFSGLNELTKDQQKAFKETFEEYKLKVHTIPFDRIGNYNWEMLISETSSYIENSTEIYHDILDKVWAPKQKLARITWNKYGWVKPSGFEGKSTNLSHEQKYGYGHEEWLFDKSKVIDGYHYGFLEPIFKYYSKYEGRNLDISLFTIDGNSKQKYWVGTLHNVEVVTKEESKSVLEIYKNKGWFKEMLSQLTDVGLDKEELNSWVNDERPWALFNIRFKVSEIDNLPESLIPVSDDDKLITSSRYNLLNIKNETVDKIKEDQNKGFSFEDSGSSVVGSSGKKVVIRKPIKREIELEQNHSEIQEKFMKILQVKYGKSKVRKECRAYGFNRIDLVRQEGDDFIFYEIKTYSSLMTGLRVALGQLLEYALYPNARNASELVLVSNIKPDEKFKTYLKHLNSALTIPISYIHFCEKEERIVEEV